MNRKIRGVVSSFASAAMLAVAGAAASNALAGPVGNESGSNLVANGGFESGDLSNWSESGLSFSQVDSLSVHSGNFAFNNGTTDAPGFISQTLNTSAGTPYNIHLWVNIDAIPGNATQLVVRWGGSTVFDSTDISTSGYQEIVIDPFATGSTTLLEIGARNDFGGSFIDDVSVLATAPEPVSVALFALGLAGLGWTRRTRA